MGHTLVARFAPESYRLIYDIMKSFQAVKIPYGRDCDRNAANEVMDYHMTLFHWAKNYDDYYLNRIENLKAVPFGAKITDACVMHAEENSWLLYFSVAPTENYAKARNVLEEALGTSVSGFLHITLAVSKNYDEIKEIEKHIQSKLTFPFEIRIEGFDLYHIWKPTEKVRSF